MAWKPLDGHGVSKGARVVAKGVKRAEAGEHRTTASVVAIGDAANPLSRKLGFSIKALGFRVLGLTGYIAN